MRLIRHLSQTITCSHNAKKTSFDFRDDFSPERAVAELVEGLELQRTNAQLWCLYLEFSSWQMSENELHHLCSAALKNAQSYDLFWTVINAHSHQI